MAKSADFQEGRMLRRGGEDDGYQSPKLGKSAHPSASFYWRLAMGPFKWLCGRAKKGQCDDAAWVFGSAWCWDILEEIGCPFDIRGMDNIDKGGEPRVFIANHMSTLETFILPAIIRPRMPVTFVVKKSLVEMPMFGHVMRSRDPIVVGRTNPREDLAAVLDGGVERLKKGISIVVFPQSTRSRNFEPEHFNSIGIKLARKANAPVVPLALKTDAWGQGRKIKELGAIRPDLPARFLFGRPMRIEGPGKKEHAEICRFIGDNIAQWQKNDGVNA